MSVYAVTSIVAPQTPRGGDEVADGFINAAEESDGDNIQVIVNFTNSVTNSDAGASIGDDVYLLNGTAGANGSGGIWYVIWSYFGPIDSSYQMLIGKKSAVVID